MKATVTLRFYDGQFWIEITDEATNNTKRLDQTYEDPDEAADALQQLGLTLNQARLMLMENANNMGTCTLKGVRISSTCASNH
jgi:hypothetical protein